MNHQLAEVPAPKALVIATIYQPQTAPQVAIHRTQGSHVLLDASASIAWVHRISMVILIAHIVALIIYVALFEVWVELGTVFVLAGFAYLLGIISSTVVLCVTSKLSYGVCGALYAGVAALNAAILFAWSTIVDFSQEGDVVFWLLLALPNIVGAISCLDGSMETLKETCNWDSIRRCAPEAPPIPIARTEIV